MNILSNNLLTTENNKFMLATFIWHLLRQPKWVSETPSQARASLSLCDDCWLHRVCMSVFRFLYQWACVSVYSSVVPTRIMMLVGASCLGPRLSINPTDGASLGSELCIWWSGGKLANGVHKHAKAHTTHPDSKIKLDTWRSLGEDPTTHYITKQSGLILSGSAWMMLTGRTQRLCMYLYVCVSIVCWPFGVRGQVVRESFATCSVTSYRSLIPSPTVQDK